jgi:VIT1/CCC1 family predicted Fe2+/Mn2+ transporter
LHGPHTEQHFKETAAVRDIVIGMADGLTVPFALAAGLTGAAVSTGIIVTAGLAEIAAGSIAMGLGGYLAARTDLEHYESERQREIRECEEIPQEEAREVGELFRGYGMNEAQVAPVIAAITADRDRWVDFMMRFELGLEAPDPKRARNSALTIAGSYVVGGLVPLAPYIVMHQVIPALEVSVAVTLAALLLFGYVKARYTGLNPVAGAFQTVLIGGLAAAAAFAIARAIT